MADNEQDELEIPNRRTMEAVRTLQGMFSGLNNRDHHKAFSNPHQKFTVVRKYAPDNTRAEEGSWKLRRSDDPDSSSVSFELSLLGGSIRHNFPASDIEEVNVKKEEVVIASSDQVNSPATIINEGGEHKKFSGDGRF